MSDIPTGAILTAPESPWGPGARPRPLDLSFGDLFDTALRQFNTARPNPREIIGRVPYETDANFDPYTQPEVQNSPSLAFRLGRARSRTEFDAMKSQMDRENYDREALSQAGFAGMAATTFAQALDPFTMFSIVSGMGTMRAGRLILGGGSGAIQSMAQGSRTQTDGLDWMLNIGLGALGNYYGGPLLNGMDRPATSAVLKSGAATYAEDFISPNAANYVEGMLRSRAGRQVGETVAPAEDLALARDYLIKEGMAPQEADALARISMNRTAYVKADGTVTGAGNDSSIFRTSEDVLRHLEETIDDQNFIQLPMLGRQQLSEVLVRQMTLGPGGLDADAMASIHSAVKVIPDVYFQNARLGIVNSFPGANGFYLERALDEGVNDLILIARGQHSGGTFAHEVGHRVLSRFLDQNDLRAAISAWEKVGKPDPGWGNSFNEWFAEEFRKAAKRVKGDAVDMTNYGVIASELRKDAAEGVDSYGVPVNVFATRIQAAFYEALDAITKLARALKGDPERAAQRFFDDLLANPRQEQTGSIFDRFGESMHDFVNQDMRTGKPYDRGGFHLNVSPTGVGLEKIKYNPLLRLGNSGFESIRAFAQKALDYGGLHTTDAPTAPMPAEVMTKVNHLPRYVDALTNHRDAYHVYRQRMAGNQVQPGTATPVTALKQFASDLVRGRNGAMGPNEFDAEVGLHLHGVDSSVPEIAQAAQHWRKFYDDTWAMGQETDLWTRDLRNQLGKLGDKIQEHRTKVEAMEVDLRAHDAQAWEANQLGKTLPGEFYVKRTEMRRALELSQNTIKALEAEAPELLKDIDKVRAMATPPSPVNAKSYFPLYPRSDLDATQRAELEQIFKHHLQKGLTQKEDLDKAAERAADMVTRWVREIPFDRFSADTVGMARSMHQRDLPIPIEQLAPYIETNVELVTRSYMRRVGAEMELSRAFDGQNLAEVVRYLKYQGEKTIEALPAAEQPKAKKALEANLADVRATWERLVGIYGMPDSAQDLTAQAVSAAKSFTYITTSGPHVLVSLPDLVRPVQVFGLKRAFSSVIEPMLRGEWDTLKLAGAEARLFGEATQTAIGIFGMMARDFGTDLAGSGFGKVSRALNSTAHGTHLLNLMAPFEDFTKRIATIVAGSELMDQVHRVAGKAPGDPDLKRLSRAFIDKPMAERIVAQFELAKQAGRGVQSGELYAPGTQAWTDLEAVRVWRAAMSSMVNQTIVTPGVGDTPLWMSTQVGSALAMYKRFGLASTQRVTMAGLQEGDRRFWMGSLAMLGAGAMSAYALGVTGYGKPWEELDVGGRFEAALDRSGVAGYLADAWNHWERLSSDKTSWPGFVSAATGPIGGQLTHAVQGVSGMVEEGLTPDTFKHLSRLTPLGGVFLLRPQVDAIASASLAQ